MQKEVDEAGEELYFACLHDEPHRADELLKSGANANHLHAERFTPLMASMMEGLDNITTLLLLGGADFKVKNVDGSMAVSYAEKWAIKSKTEEEKRACQRCVDIHKMHEEGKLKGSAPAKRLETLLAAPPAPKAD